MTPAIEPITQLRLLLEQLQRLILKSICWKESADLQMPHHSFPLPLLQIVPWSFSSMLQTLLVSALATWTDLYPCHWGQSEDA